MIFSVFVSISNHHHYLNPNHFPHSKMKCHGHWQSLPLLPIPSQPQVYFLSLWICLFRIFHTNGIVIYSPLWLASFTSFSTFIHFVACMGTTFLFMADRYSIAWVRRILSLGRLHSSAVTRNAAANIHEQRSRRFWFHGPRAEPLHLTVPLCRLETFFRKCPACGLLRSFMPRNLLRPLLSLRWHTCRLCAITE